MTSIPSEYTKVPMQSSLENLFKSELSVQHEFVQRNQGDQSNCELHQQKYFRLWDVARCSVLQQLVRAQRPVHCSCGIFVCCNLLCVAIRCSVLQCVAVCCSVLQYAAACCSVLQVVAVCYSVLQCDTVRYSVLQCVAVCCSALQSVAVRAVCCSKGTAFMVQPFHDSPLNHPIQTKYTNSSPIHTQSLHFEDIIPHICHTGNTKQSSIHTKSRRSGDITSHTCDLSMALL